MPQALSIKPEPYQHAWTPGGEVRRDLHRLGLPAEGLREVGRARLPVGQALRREVRQGRGRDSGTGRRGTKRTSATGAARRRSSASCTTTRSTASAARCRRRGSAGRTPPAAAASSPATSSSTSCAARTSPPARSARRSTSCRSTPRAGPTFVDGHVRMGIAEPAARRSTTASRIIASFPELKAKPIVIGESDPDGCAACQGPQLGYRNTTMYSSYTAAAFARKHDLAERHGVNLEGALTWAFEFEDQPYFAGFRVLATQRHRPAGVQRLPHVQPDGRRADRGRQRRRRRARRDHEGRRPRQAGRRRARQPRREEGHGPGLALPRRRRRRARRRRHAVARGPGLEAAARPS